MLGQMTQDGAGEDDDKSPDRAQENDENSKEPSASKNKSAKPEQNGNDFEDEDERDDL
jgi:hypothetical protein